jgi:hypothetical protein
MGQVQRFYVTTNIGYGYERVQWLGSFDTKEEAEYYISNSSEGSWEGPCRVESDWVDTEKKITVSLSFDFYPNGDHEDLFEGMTDDEMIEDAKRMACEDIYTLSNSNDIMRQLDVRITEE